jgi:hypothetical protein
MFINIPNIAVPFGLAGKTIWRFSLFTHPDRLELRLMNYSFLERKSSRHKWIVTAQWDRLDRRYNTISEPPSPPPDECDKLIKKVSKLIYVSWDSK